MSNLASKSKHRHKNINIRIANLKSKENGEEKTTNNNNNDDKKTAKKEKKHFFFLSDIRVNIWIIYLYVHIDRKTDNHLSKTSECLSYE